MTTALDIINSALTDAGVLGVGQTALAADTTKALTRLNWMIDQWARKRTLIYALTDTIFTMDGRTTPYTVGPTGNYVIAVRPADLKFAFLRQLVNSTPNQVDYPLDVIKAREDYDRIALKSLISWPTKVFYDSAWPQGNLYVYPWPQGGGIYAISLAMMTVLSELTTPATVVNLPPEYMAALHYNLALRLRSAYMRPAPPPGQDDLKALAKDALSVLRAANAQIPILHMPEALQRPGIYNIYNDQSY